MAGELSGRTLSAMGLLGRGLFRSLGINAGHEKKESVQFSHFASIRFIIRLSVLNGDVMIVTIFIND
jgi:hypothetical protein